MSILPRHRHVANPADVEAFTQICCSPACSASAHPDLPTPMCLNCARGLAYAYLAATQPPPDGEWVDPRPAEYQALPPMDKLSESGLVYFVRFGDRVKIGFTTNLSQRMQAIPHDEVLATFPGTYRDERRCHAAFAHLRITGEWFQDDEQIREFIAARAA